MNQKDYNEQLVKEIADNPDLLSDKLWRMDHLYWITTKKGTKTMFKMNRAQRDFATKWLLIPSPYFRHIILKSRQLGFTTFIDLFILDETIFNPNREGLVIAHKVGDAAEIFDKKVDFAVRNFSPELKEALFEVRRNSAKKIQFAFDNGDDKESVSGIAVSIAGRGNTVQYLHVSEFASMCVLFPKRANDLEQSTFPAVPLDGYIFIESTAEGMSGRFYEIFSASWKIRDQITTTMSQAIFVPHFYNWTWDDEEIGKIAEDIPVSSMEVAEIDWGEYQREHFLTNKQITFYYMKWLQLGRNIQKLRQEYPTTAEEAFVSSGQTYFPTTRVVTLLSIVGDGVRGDVVKDEKGVYKFQNNSGGDLEIFNAPEKGVSYVIGGDTAEGLASGDAQVLVVINARTEKIDAIYKSQVPPDEFADVAYDIGKFYNGALMAIESNKDGLWVNTHLEKRGYLNLYYRSVLDDITKSVTKYFGWRTTSATRPFMLASLKAYFMRIGWFPKALLEEMLTFVRNAKGRPEAMQGKHDDVIMAASVGYSVLQERGKQPEALSSENSSLYKTIFGESDVVNF